MSHQEPFRSSNNQRPEMLMTLASGFLAIALRPAPRPLLDLRKITLLAAFTFCFMTGGTALAQDEAEVESPEPGLELLDKATTAKFSVSKLSDLDVVVALCEEAIAAGLSSENEVFAKQMITATLYEKANRLVESVIKGGRPVGWAQRRRLSVRALEKAIEMDPEHAESHLLLARIDMQPGGDLERGRTAANRAVELLAENPGRQSIALLTLSTYREDMATRLADVDLAIERDPNHADAYRDRGQLHFLAGEIDKAVADFSRLLELDSNDPEAIQQLARGLALQEEFDKALELVDQLMQLREDAAGPYALRASIRIQQGQLDQALEDLNHAIELEPDDPRSLLSRSELHLSLEKLDEALDDVDRVLARHSGLIVAIDLKVSILVAQEDFKQAAETLQPLAAAMPENQARQFQLATLYSIATQSDEAIAIYDALLDAEDPPWEAFRGRADTYLNVGAHAEAITDYEEALAKQPDDSSILNNLSWVLSTSTIDELRNGERALELAERACEITNFEQAHIISTLAAAHAELGDFDKAIEWSQKAVMQGEGEVKGQLEEELQGYKQGKPWRERKTQDASEDPDLDDISMDDLQLDTAAARESDATPRIPVDP